MTKEQENRKKIKQIVDEMSIEEIEERIKQDEQEEAIERLESIDETVEEYDGNVLKADIETVLNMLKQNSAEIQQKNTEIAEKSAEIEELKQVLARNIAKNFTSSMKESAKSKEDLEMLNKGWQIELEKKDRQINSKNGTINALQCALKERTEERDRKDKIIARQRKQIDLMIDYIDKLSEYYTKIEGKNNEFCDEKCIDKNIDCYDCIKQYFERKCEE